MSSVKLDFIYLAMPRIASLALGGSLAHLYCVQHYYDYVARIWLCY